MAWLARTRSLLLAPVILVWTAVMAVVSLATSVNDPKGCRQHSCARFWAIFILRISGVGLRVRNTAVLGKGPYVFVSNHQSFYDILALLAALPVPFRFVAKQSLFRVPFLGWHLRRAGHIALDRSRPRSAYRSLEAAAARIRCGDSVLIFPEGSRSRDGEISDFKKGSMRLAEVAGVPVVPVAIYGTATILPRGSMMVSPGQIDVAVAEPVGLTDDAFSREFLVQAVREQITLRYRQLERSRRLQEVFLPGARGM
jgi:1-acyl-sn-glycerol-3-phosphate acyltransferase